MEKIDSYPLAGSLEAFADKQMLTSNIFKRGGPKKESGSVPKQSTREKAHDDDPDAESEQGLDSDEDGEGAIPIQELRNVLSAPRTG